MANAVCSETEAGKKTSRTADGYTLLSVHENDSGAAHLALIDMKGVMVKRWPLYGYPALPLPGGSVMGLKELVDSKTGASTGDATLVQLDWSGKEELNARDWLHENGVSVTSNQHHDLQRSPNPTGTFAPGQAPSEDGHLLMLSRNTAKVPAVSDKLIGDDVIHQFRSDGQTTGFRWAASDHIDEFGFTAEDRESIRSNPNWNAHQGQGDWIHLNAMSTLGWNRWYEQDDDPRFHPDNILISSRQANILAIISRETGRIVWRAGPDYSKGAAAHALGQIVGQHNAHMIPFGLPGAGNILLFDNGGLAGYGSNMAIRTHSRVLEFNPVTLEKVWEYGGPKGTKGHFFSLLLGGVQRLPNGNTLITDGVNGMIVEVNRAGDTVWTYATPVGSKGNRAYLYRAQRLPPDWLPAGINPGDYLPWSERYICPR